MCARSCVPNTIRNRNLPTSNDDDSFYHDQNYKSMIKCLDRGYSHSTQLQTTMNNYCEIAQQEIKSYKSFKQKCPSNHSSVHTPYANTNAAKNQLISMSTQLITPKRIRYDNMKAVVTSYEKKLNEMYPRHLFSRKHYQAEDVQERFAVAQSKCSEIRANLAELNEQKQNIRKARKKVKPDDDDDSDDEEDQLENLTDIKEQISQKKQDLIREKEKYRTKANKIYQDCRKFEEERLKLYKKTLKDFIEAMNPRNYVDEENMIYEELLEDVELKLNIDEDLDSWADAYEIQTDN